MLEPGEGTLRPLLIFVFKACSETGDASVFRVRAVAQLVE